MWTPVPGAFEHFLSAYLGPICSFIGLMAIGSMAILGMKLDARLARLKLDILTAVNGKYLHSDVAELKFETINYKLDQLNVQLKPVTEEAAAKVLKTAIDAAAALVAARER
jgi:hypothetical protein